MVDVEKWVTVLADAESSRQPVKPISEFEGSFDLADGYAVQAGLIARRVAQGERVVGAKLGLTSKAKQLAMGIDTPIFGGLTDGMKLQPHQPVALAELVHPRAEPEIAFLIGKDLAGPRATAHDVLNATDGVCGAFEIIDSRYVDFRFTLPDVVADNTSACRFLLGTTVVDPHRVDLALLGVVLESAGSVLATAAGAAILGHPAVAVALLANELARRDEVIPAGSVILSGGLTNAETLVAGGRLTANFAHLGSVELLAE